MHHLQGRLSFIASLLLFDLSSYLVYLWVVSTAVKGKGRARTVIVCFFAEVKWRMVKTVIAEAEQMNRADSWRARAARR